MGVQILLILVMLDVPNMPVLQVIMKVSERSFHNQRSSNLVTGLILAEPR